MTERLKCAKQCLTLHLNRSTGALDVFVIPDILWLQIRVYVLRGTATIWAAILIWW